MDRGAPQSAARWRFSGNFLSYLTHYLTGPHLRGPVFPVSYLTRMTS
jgi:hypothetical protein